MEIDIQKERERVETEIGALNQRMTQTQQQLNNWNSQREQIAALLLKKNGELEFILRFSEGKTNQ